jgi:hypothetical protein
LFDLRTLRELLAEPPAVRRYRVEDLLVDGTTSLIIAKPKVGKGTLTRNLCLSVSRGEPFLGMETRQGLCIYLALEERKEDVVAEFRAMGASGDEPILVHAAAAPKEGIAAVCDLVGELEPALLVIDPLVRIAHIRDEKAYAEMYNALGPLIDAARQVETHITIDHHAGKSLKSDAVDAPLGSTAIAGMACTLIVLKRSQAGARTIQTVQRVGTDMPETVLHFDEDTHRLSLGTSRFEADKQECGRRILEFLRETEAPQTQQQIRSGVEGETRIIRAALTGLVASAKVERAGDGLRGNPFKYWFAGSEYIQQTTKPETKKVDEPA